MHDIPYTCDPSGHVYNMVVEIPRHTHAKMETSIKSESNPIVQDVKKGKKRFLKNVWPLYGYPGNYGMIPQVLIIFYLFFILIINDLLSFICIKYSIQVCYKSQ